MKRVVTGHDANGKAVVLSQDAPAKIAHIDAIPGTYFYEIWNTNQMPVGLAKAAADPTLKELQLRPTPSGSVIRFVDIPPDTADYLAHGARKMGQAFSQIGDAHASTVKKSSPHPLMHRTESIDYGIVIEGEMTLVLDDSEVTLKPGDVVVQRGTNHAWSNRGSVPCRMAFILLDGRYEDGLREQIAQYDQP
jgi:mannose-6-phosphate isomerase-like protein (cupin superfamily)